MTYQYGVVIYGIPIDDTVNNFFNSLASGDDEDPVFSAFTEEEREDLYSEWEEANHPFGFVKFYNSSGNNVLGYLGVRLLREDVSSWSPARLRDLTSFQPTPEQKAQVEQILKQLPPLLREKVGDPDIWLVWGSS